MKKYLEERTRSKLEQKMHALLQTFSDGKITVEEMQLFFDQTTRPLDFIRRYEDKLNFSSDKETKDFFDSLMVLWNQTPRTELHGKSPSQTYEHEEKRCKLCEVKPACPHCGERLTERGLYAHTTYGQEGEMKELFCEKCKKNFHDFSMDLSPKIDEETHSRVEELATTITDNCFNGVWKNFKKEVSDLSKKELAEEMFFAGVVNSLISFYAFGVPKEMLKVWAKMFGGEEEEMEQAMKELEEKMKVKK